MFVKTAKSCYDEFMRKKLIGFLLLFFLLPLLIYSVFQIQNYLTRASVQPANIVIDTQKLGGKVTRPWASYAQGGEETEKVFTNLIAKMQPLKPRFIRIDHIYDFYDVVHKTEGGFSYDFSKLDKTVDEILSTGALPFFSLSYMPRVFTSNNSVIDTPTDWQLLNSIQGVSGKISPECIMRYGTSPSFLNLVPGNSREIRITDRCITMPLRVQKKRRFLTLFSWEDPRWAPTTVPGYLIF